MRSGLAPLQDHLASVSTCGNSRLQSPGHRRLSQHPDHMASWGLSSWALGPVAAFCHWFRSKPGTRAQSPQVGRVGGAAVWKCPGSRQGLCLPRSGVQCCAPRPAPLAIPVALSPCPYPGSHGNPPHLNPLDPSNLAWAECTSLSSRHGGLSAGLSPWARTPPHCASARVCTHTHWNFRSAPTARGHCGGLPTCLGTNEVTKVTALGGGGRGGEEPTSL